MHFITKCDLVWYSDDISPEYYKYYALPKDEEYEELVAKFQPSEDDMILFKGTRIQERCIYPSTGYSENEEAKLDEFYKLIQLVHFIF